METKIVKPVTVKPSVGKTLKEKLIAAVNKVLKDNNYDLTKKIDKVINKSTKKIVKKTNKQIKKALRAK